MVSMEKYEIIENRFIKRLDAFDAENPVDTFENLWGNKKHYAKHLSKRLRDGDISSPYEYVKKTFATLAQKTAYYEHYKQADVWDRVIYNQELKWAVIIGESGEILTSYKPSRGIIDLLATHKERYGSEYEETGVSNEFQKRVAAVNQKLGEL